MNKQAPSTAPTHVQPVPREFLEYLETRLYRIEEAILGLRQALVSTDARGWVSYLLLEDMVKGEVQDLNQLRERIKELSEMYATRLQESAEQEEERRVADPDEEIVLGG